MEQNTKITYLLKIREFQKTPSGCGMGEGLPLSNTVTLFIFNHLHDWFTFDRYLLDGHYGPGKEINTEDAKVIT